MSKATRERCDTSKVTRLAVRGFAGGRKLFEERVDIAEEDLDDKLPNLAEKHATELAKHEVHMVEIEFLDEPDPLERFFRFGTDPTLMVMPVGMMLGGGRFKD